MHKKTLLSEFIRLGESLFHLNHSPDPQLDVYLKEIETFIRSLELCDLPATKAAASSLTFNNIRYQIPTRTISERDLHRLRGMMTSISHALYHEAGKKEMIALNVGDVSNQLRELPQKLKLTASQEHLLDETIRCIECEAYRAAAVMGWNLAFDCIRQWVFDHRLADFNHQLIVLFPDKRIIRDYLDFFASEAPAESHILMICNDRRMPNGRILGTKLYDDLTQYLRLRNQYAHATDLMPSAHKINSYLENLIDIITRGPFIEVP